MQQPWGRAFVPRSGGKQECATPPGVALGGSGRVLPSLGGFALGLGQVNVCIDMLTQRQRDQMVMALRGDRSW